MTCRVAADRFLITSTCVCVWCVSLKNAKIIWVGFNIFDQFKEKLSQIFWRICKSRCRGGRNLVTCLNSYLEDSASSPQYQHSETSLWHFYWHYWNKTPCNAFAQTLNALMWSDDWLHPQRSNLRPWFENLLTPIASHFNLNNKQASILGEINKAALWWDLSVLFAESQALPACCTMITELCAGKETSLKAANCADLGVYTSWINLLHKHYKNLSYCGGKCVRDMSKAGSLN